MSLRRKKGLGAWPSVDMRDMAHPIGTHLKALGAVVPTAKTWQIGEILDQGYEGSCVGHGWTAWENCRPSGYTVQQDHAYALSFYERAQELDEWWGTDYEGTSVRAGAKVARERGLLSEYVWASSASDIDGWLLLKGPLVIGSLWLESMDEPDRDGFITVEPQSPVRGGHCYLLYGKGEGGNYKLQNSWGYDYAREGTFRLSPENLQTLIDLGSFQACAAVQTGEA